MARAMDFQYRVLVSKILDDSNIDSAFYPIEVNQMSTKYVSHRYLPLVCTKVV